MTDSDFNKFNEIDKLIKGVVEPSGLQANLTLRSLFEQKLAELEMSAAVALEILGIERRTLDGILDATQKRVDFVALAKIASFLEISKEELILLYMRALEQTNKEDFKETEKRKFIVNNFDLVTLRKIGLIDSISDFDQVERELNFFFGFNSIFDYGKLKISPAFSEGARKPKSLLNREFWIQSAALSFQQINNGFDYERKALLEYFPKIRWHSMNIEKGLFQVIRALFKLGVTVIYQPPIPTVHLRGATFALNNKPCIVLTDYRGFYATLWFALIHELFHVLFDWEEIKQNVYHVSDAETDLFTVQEKEQEANHFAREFLFGKEKMDVARPHLDDRYFVEKYARENHVHSSIIYVFDAYDVDKAESGRAWARAQRHNPDITKCLTSLINNPWQERKSIRELAKQRVEQIFKIE
jgi:HTH-type transcriptional regulator/antitoxin HigA